MSTGTLLLVLLAVWVALAGRRRLRRLVIGLVLLGGLGGLVGVAMAVAMFGPGALREFSGHYGDGPRWPRRGGPSPAFGPRPEYETQRRPWRSRQDPLRAVAARLGWAR